MTRRLQGRDLIDFRDAILDNFDASQLDTLLLGFNIRLTDKVNPDSGGMEDVALKLIKRAEEEGWLLNLVESTAKARPTEPRFIYISEKFQPIISGMNDDPCDSLILHGGAAMIDRKGLRQ